MKSASGRWILSFNGEIYNFESIRRELEKSVGAIGWRGHSDTEVLLAAIDAWGIAGALTRSVGMFAFALWDRQACELHLVRDRMGEKPLYYGWAGSSLVFGSELKALRAHPQWRGEVDRDSLSLFFRHNYIPSPYSIYKNVRKVPPGAWLTVSLDDVHQAQLPEPRPYWSLLGVARSAKANPFAGTEQEAITEAERLCLSAVRQQTVSDVPVGAFLSGGIDSSTIVTFMQAQSSQPVRTFTVGFEDDDYDEAAYARAIAERLGTVHTELRLHEHQALRSVPDLALIYDEPFSDSSQLPTYLVSKLARNSVTVSLSGDGGDELFGGYNRYFLGRTLHRRLLTLPQWVRRDISRMVQSCSPPLLNFILRPLSAIIPDFRVAQPSDKAYKAAEVLALDTDASVYRRLVSHWDDPESLVRGAREPPTTLDSLLEQQDIAATFEQWMMTSDMATYLPDDILVKLDRAAMAASLETRVPFLQHELIEFALSLPTEMKIRGKQGKWLLRELLSRHLPKHLFQRPKMGFTVPIDSWLRGGLRDWAEALLDEGRLRREGYLNPGPITAKWREHLSGARNWQHYLWDVLMFQSWLEEQSKPIER
jgi:asparagine synthase (glutamine-hydrolysing)